MKKLAKLSCIILLPIIIGLILIIIGIATKNDNILYSGIMVLTIGIPVVMFLLVVISLIHLITGKWSLDDDKNAKNGKKDIKTSNKTAKDERNDIKEINSSYGYDNWEKRGKYEAEHISNNYKHSYLGEKIKSWLLFGFIVANFALVMVFAFLGIWIGAIICFCLFCGTILICFIVKTILEKVSQSKKSDPLKYQPKTGTVKATLYSSMRGWGSKNTQHISSVTYRVLIKVGNKTYNAYSKHFYEEGETVEVLVRRDGKGNAKIQSPPKNSGKSDNN